MNIKAIPENSYKFLQKKLAKILQEKRDLEEDMGVTDPHSQTFQEFKNKIISLHNEAVEIIQLLKAPVAKIEDQSEKCLLGSGALVLVNNKLKEIFIDAACIGKSASVSVNCQLAQAILGKKVKDEGSYLCRNTGKMIYWEILGLRPYSLAKSIFKKNRERLQIA